MTKEQRIRAECERRGLNIERTGKAWHIFGRGVDIRVARLEDAELRELNVSAPIPTYRIISA
jgi:hypothetical protein